MADWFLKAEGNVQGPLSEAALRAAITDYESDDLEVRQGQSDWYPADVVRKKYEVLNQNGVFIRFKQVAEGPFTLNKAYESLISVDPKGIQVRMGRDGSWVNARKWINAVDRLKRKEKDAVLTAVSQLFDSGDLSDCAVSPSPQKGLATSYDAAPAVDDMDAMENENGVTKVSRPLDPHHADRNSIASCPSDKPPAVEEERADFAALASSQSSGPTENQAGVFESPPAINLANFHRDPLAGLATQADLGRTYESQHPRARIETSSRDAWGRMFGFSLGGIVFLMLGSLIAAGYIKRNSLQYQASQAQARPQSQAQPQSTLVDIGQINRAPSATEQGEEGGNRGAFSDASTAMPPGRSASSSSIRPPLVSDGMLFRPTIQTTNGVIDAGTAFAAEITGSSKTFLLTALHLFGPAGGLSQDMNPADVPRQWEALKLRDCKSRIEHDEVRIDPILLDQTQPLPNVSAQGDVAACAVEESGYLRLKPLKISSSVLRPGEKVWLVSEVIGSQSLVHPAIVEGIEQGWAVYRFDQAIELRATSGAPVVDGRGQVVAVHAGGGNEGGIVVGVGTPTSKFANVLMMQ
ncbi:MAG: hypothetical protein P8L85_16885 [Rubripirellula sp.]|nr:hypothetical protein [Rubripirellula sp.]